MGGDKTMARVNDVHVNVLGTAWLPTREYGVVKRGSLTVGWLRQIGYYVFQQINASLHAYFYDTFFTAIDPPEHERVVPESNPTSLERDEEPK
eukprot:51918-Pyramimonas_sp.AAC.1